MSVKHDAEILKRFLGSAPQIKRDLMVAASGEARHLVRVGFQSESDPSSDPWQPLVYREGKILRLTGRMANSFTAWPTDKGFVVGTNVEYAQYHQDGTRGLSKSSAKMRLVGPQGQFVTAQGKARVTGKDGKKRSKKLGIHGTKLVVHVKGSGKIPKRPMVPEGGQLTAKWQEAIDKVVDSKMRKIVRDIDGHN
jgi:phage gpG-like protein